MRISDWSSDVWSSDLRRHDRRSWDPWERSARLWPCHPCRAAPRSEMRHLQAPRRHIRASRRSEEHTSELQSLMRNSYAVFCLKKKTINHHHIDIPLAKLTKLFICYILETIATKQNITNIL